MVKPLTGQANFSEKMMRPSGACVARTLRSAAFSSAAATPVRSGAGRVLRRIGGVEEGEAFGELERGLEAVGEARLDAFADDDAVDDDLDVVLVFLVERGRFFDRIKGAVDPDAGEARLLPLGKLLAVLALAAADDGGEQIVAAALGKRHGAVDHLADGLRGDGQARRGRIRDADARPQQAHVVVDLSDRGDRRARVARGRLLLD